MFTNSRATFLKTSIRPTLPDLDAILCLFPFAPFDHNVDICSMHATDGLKSVKPFRSGMQWTQGKVFWRTPAFQCLTTQQCLTRNTNDANSSSETPGHLESGYIFYFVSLCSLTACHDLRRFYNVSF